MTQNIILAGVGGQGILTIARVLSIAAEAKGLHVKQAEVHGMSQRGGAVYSHLRISDGVIYSDLIPKGQADLILAVEPLEALRYRPMLRPNGAIASNSKAMTNIGNYPSIEELLAHIAAAARHAAFDCDRLARASGSVLAANIAALGAASPFVRFSSEELEAAIATLFARKSERVVEANIRAFRLGKLASSLYLEALQAGTSPKQARSWLESLTPEQIESGSTSPPDEFAEFDPTNMTGAEEHAFENVLLRAYEEGRKPLYEHEVYRLIELVGAITPPRHTFVPRGSTIDPEVLLQYPGEKVVVKLVSPDVVHKSDVDAVAFVPKEADAVGAAIRRMTSRHSQDAHIEGTLVIEFVEHDSRGLGGELFVGIRATREFGPVIAAGFGGQNTEYLAAKMRPGVAVAKAVVAQTSAEEFLEQFRQTAAYDILAGKTRGGERMVSDAELLRCFKVFHAIASRFCVARGEEGPDLAELEINPFAFQQQRMIPLDGRGRLGAQASQAAARPLQRVEALLHPKSIAIIGVSSKPEGFGRIIVRSVLDAGFDPLKVHIIKAGCDELEGAVCVPDFDSLPEAADLLVIAAPATAVPQIIAEANASGKVQAGIIISGGAGETPETGELGQQIVAAIQEGRKRPDGGAVFVGPNCMGILSRPASCDTFFIPRERMPVKAQSPKPYALISQSGAFAVARLSSLSHLDPQYAITIGNQADVTVSDLLHVLAERDDLQTVGIYLEGFADLDGVESARAIKRWTDQGKTVVVYKAGRTESGRSAAAGHTAAVAGDYDVCQTALQQAGAWVASDMREFGQLLEVAAAFGGKSAVEGRAFAITNAGMEAVSLADGASPDGVHFSALSGALLERAVEILGRLRLNQLVSPRNPMDVTPAAAEEAYDELVRAALAQPDVDLAIVSCVPLAPGLRTLSHQLDDPNSFPRLLPGWLAAGKPVAFVVDAGELYEPLVQAIRAQGVPVFRSADEAVRVIGRWARRR